MRFNLHLLKISLLTGLFTLNFNNQTLAQENTADGLGTWLVVAGKAHVNEKWSIPFCGILREYNIAQQTEFGFLQAGLGYKLNPKTSLSVGAAYLDRHPFEHDYDQATNQFWLYHQVAYKATNYWNHRFRIENRWFINDFGSTLKSRVRYRLQYTYPINKKHYIKCFEEAFLSLKEGNINQNRFFLGYGRKLTKHLKFEVGYLKLHVGKNNFDRIRMVMLVNTKLFSQKSDLVAHRN